ncbi:MAG TPA: MBL fold metallo-hydrolase [Stellaceae bacterium]|jgi:glyoxylase-like metal-dependent hydrolase (beta-lactamase superfamily II)|nr:MBL fold metallo-hydrolase [Stellaceae bacterium]
MAGEIPFRRNFAFEYGRSERLTPLIRRVVARNASPFTFKGTGTYIIGQGKVAVIDPGPKQQDHIDALLKALDGETVTHILITHTHNDHSPAAAAIKAATGAKTYGFGPHGSGRAEERLGGVTEEGGDREFVPDVTLRDGNTLEGGGEGPGWRIAAVETPGHTSNHLCYALAEERTLFTGDHVMGWSTSVIAPPDGDMAAYLRSLNKLLFRDDAVYWPTHGPSIPDPKPFVAAFIAHRHERSAAIVTALALGDDTIPAIVARVYVGLDPKLIAAAGRSVFAHLVELIETGKVVCDGPPSLEAHYRAAR